MIRVRNDTHKSSNAVCEMYSKRTVSFICFIICFVIPTAVEESQSIRSLHAGRDDSLFYILFVTSSAFRQAQCDTSVTLICFVIPTTVEESQCI